MPIRGSPNGARHPYPQVVAIPRSRGRDPSEQVVAINWNEWSRSIGIAGRDHPVRAFPGNILLNGKLFHHVVERTEVPIPLELSTHLIASLRSASRQSK
jgi:hypothetical protein